MVKTDEFMIGNWVLVEDKPRQVAAFTRKKIGFHYKPNESRMHYARVCQIQPIPLTSELLLSLGFVRTTDVRGWTLYRFRDFALLEWSYGNWYFSFAKDRTHGTPIRYVHQFQNAMHAIHRNLFNIKLNEE